METLSVGFKIYSRTVNVGASKFLIQKKLTTKQANWKKSLAKFDLVLEYNPGRLNIVTDPLSRKKEFPVMIVKPDIGVST